MTLTVNMIVQIVGLIISLLTVVSGIVSPEHAAIVLAIVGTLKAAVAAYAQHYNTNGTPQEVPGGKAAEEKI